MKVNDYTARRIIVREDGSTASQTNEQLQAERDAIDTNLREEWAMHQILEELRRGGAGREGRALLLDRLAMCATDAAEALREAERHTVS